MLSAAIHVARRKGISFSGQLGRPARRHRGSRLFVVFYSVNFLYCEQATDFKEVLPTGNSHTIPIPDMKIRKAFVMSVHASAEQEYEKHHNPIWPLLPKDHEVSRISI
jgi:hypothetical protein